MWILFGIVYITCFLFLFLKKSKLFFNPVFWMVASATLVIGLYFSSGFEYVHPLKVSGLLYYLLIIGCFYLGFVSSKRIDVGRKKFLLKNHNVEKEKKGILAKANVCVWLDRRVSLLRKSISYNKLLSPIYKKMTSVTSQADYNSFFRGMNISVYFLVSIVGVLVFCIDFFIHNSLSSGDLHTEAVISTIGILGKICLLLGIVVWLCELAYSIQSNKQISWVGCLGAIIYFIPAVITSGRQTFIIFIIATISIFVYSLNVQKEYKYIKQFILIGIIAICLIVMFCVFVAITRQSVSNKAELFESMFNCKIPDDTERLFLKMGALGMFFCEIVSYYSHELPMFQVFFDNWDCYPMLGASQFQLISRNINPDSMFSYDTMWENLDIMSAEAGIYSHVWRTISADCIIDYGRVGGLIFMVILGFLAGWTYKKVIESNQMNYQILLSMINSGAFFSMQFSPLVEEYWYFPMMWIVIALPILNRVIKGVIKK